MVCRIWFAVYHYNPRQGTAVSKLQAVVRGKQNRRHPLDTLCVETLSAAAAPTTTIRDSGGGMQKVQEARRRVAGAARHAERQQSELGESTRSILDDMNESRVTPRTHQHHGTQQTIGATRRMFFESPSAAAAASSGALAGRRSGEGTGFFLGAGAVGASPPLRVPGVCAVPRAPRVCMTKEQQASAVWSASRNPPVRASPPRGRDMKFDLITNRPSNGGEITTARPVGGVVMEAGQRHMRRVDECGSGLPRNAAGAAIMISPGASSLGGGISGRNNGSGRHPHTRSGPVIGVASARMTTARERALWGQAGPSRCAIDHSLWQSGGS